jgi:threonine/homoserine/homoserine lactone efflux protein
MPDLSALLSVATLWILAVVTPGPNFLVTARLSVGQSRREGLRAVAGIGVGTAIWAAAGCFGVQALFIAAPWMFVGLKILGGLYLICLGGKIIWLSRHPDLQDFAARGSVRSGLSAFRLGLVTNVANPKSALFVASIFATSMPSHPPLALALAAMSTMIAISLAWYALVACLFTLGGGRLPAVPALDRSQRGRVLHPVRREARGESLGDEFGGQGHASLQSGPKEACSIAIG